MAPSGSPASQELLFLKSSPLLESGALFQLKLEHYCWGQEQLVAPGLVALFELTPLNGVLRFSRLSSAGRALDL